MASRRGYRGSSLPASTSALTRVSSGPVSSQTNCVDVDSIEWVDAAGDYMCVHVNGEIFVLRGTMKRLEELLDPAMFVRIHRSAIVNRNRVKALRPHRNGEYFLKLDCDHELKLSRKYKSALSRFADNL